MQPLFDDPASVAALAALASIWELWRVATAPLGGCRERCPPIGSISLGMDCSGKKTDLFQCPNVPVARGYDLDQSIEQFRIIVPPLVWPMKVADMSPISIVALVWV